MAINVKPLGDRVLFSRSKRTKSRRKASSFPTRRKRKPQEGTVVAVGTGKLDDNGKKFEFNVKVGDKVLISKYGDTEWPLS